MASQNQHEKIFKELDKIYYESSTPGSYGGVQRLKIIYQIRLVTACINQHAKTFHGILQ
ncbi:MAG: hypothetical protein FD143_3483 [Ignavibacteria bacterium]|nr:MAG: hypothetical protein FD143_3483 [Ignavibacteria bacterium]